MAIGERRLSRRPTSPTCPTSSGSPGRAKPDPILVADGVRRPFGGLVAVDVDHVEVQRGTITALIGPNGAGKTTFFNLLTGFDKPDAGAWTFDGSDLAGVPAHKVARQGMVRTFQLTKSLARLTVIENMKLGATGQRGERFFRACSGRLWRDQERRDRGPGRRAARALQARPHARRVRRRRCRAASASCWRWPGRSWPSPQLIMLDEPMAGVNPALTQSLLGHVKSLRERRA